MRSLKSPPPKIFYFLSFAFLACYLAILPGCATSPVIKMPQPLPNIVKEYKSLKIYGTNTGLVNTGIHIKQGDYFTIVATGEIRYIGSGRRVYSSGPEGWLIWQIGEKGKPELYGYNAYSNNVKHRENGPLFFCLTRSPTAYSGSFNVEIIVWKKEDPILIATFFKEMLSKDPQNRALKEIAEHYRIEKEFFFAEQKAAKEIEETQKALLALKEDVPKQVGEKPKPAVVSPQEKAIKKIKKEEPVLQPPIVTPKLQEEIKVTSATKEKEIATIKELTPAPRKEPAGIKGAEKGKKIAELDERLKTPAGVDPAIKKIKEVKKTEPGTKPVFVTPKLPEEKKTAPPAKEKEILKAKDSHSAPGKELAGIKDLEREKKIADLNEKLQKAMQALKYLEEMKKKMAAQQKKEAELSARLKTLEAQKIAQLQTPPVIAIANPKEGITVDSEYISLFGVAEHERGISRFEIRVNNQPVDSKGQRDLKVLPKEQKRIEFSERIRLKEGKNELTIIAQEKQGLVTQKTISVQMTKKREEVWAVVVGISKYKNILSLKYASRDAQEFYRYLTEVNQVPKDNIWLLLDEEATLNKLRSTLGTHLRRKAGKDDLVMIYLAGHGATEKDAASYDGDGLEKYILPHNADPKDLYASAMPMSEVARIFQRISSERLVFISDTCYSGASGGRTLPLLGTRANVSGAFLERLSQGRGRVIITASDANEVSVEKDELKHGVFTYYLLEALRGKGDLDGDGVISVDEAYRYVSTKVPQATGQDQHPVKKGEVTGQIVLGVVK